MIVAGIDAGSRTVKTVLLDSASRKIVASGICDQGVNQKTVASRLFSEMLKKARIARGRVKKVVATGYGRDSLDFADTAITEITCHAVGVRHMHPDARTVIDIGGQDSKVIRIDENGNVRDFVMNDRCAAGTGRFLEVVASRMGVRLEDYGKLAGKARRSAVISSMCVVFAETEIIGLLASGEAPAAIAAGVQRSVASRVASMAGRKVVPPVFFTGGVVLVPGMVKAMAVTLGCRVQSTIMPQYTGAIGAAILAAN